MEETVLLHFEIDAPKAEKDLIAVTKVMIANKEAQQELTKAYKAGNITQQEFAEESVRLQSNLKKEQETHKNLITAVNIESGSRNALRQKVSQLTKEYDNINQSTKTGADRAKVLEKELFKLNTQLSEGNQKAKLFKNEIGNYPHAFAEASREIELSGVSVGGLADKFKMFLNPATAVAGVIAGLVGAYAESTLGAKDLEKATDTLSAGFGIASNHFAEFVQNLTKSSRKGGPLELAANAINRVLFGQGIANQAEAMAAANEIIRQLEISEQFAKGFAKDAETRAEKARIIRDNDNEDLLTRLAQVKKVEDALTNSEQLRIIVLQAQKQAIIDATEEYDNNLEAQLKVAGVDAEIKDIQENINGKLTENVNARKNILKLIEDERIQTERLNRISKPSSDPKGPGDLAKDAKVKQDIKTSFLVEESDIELQIKKGTNDKLLQFQKQYNADQIAEHQRAAAAKQASDQAYLQAASMITGELSQLAAQGSTEQKALALITIAIDEAKAISALVAASNENPYNAFTEGGAGAIQFASGIVQIIDGIAQAKELLGGFYDGGWTGPGNKYDAVGIVHADEYVTPKHIVNSPAAQPHLNALERMRLGGYYDGGFVTNQNTASANQAMITANALRNLPQPILSVVEFNRVAKKVSVKESLSKL